MRHAQSVTEDDILFTFWDRFDDDIYLCVLHSRSKHIVFQCHSLLWQYELIVLHNDLNVKIFVTKKSD